MTTLARPVPATRASTRSGSDSLPLTRGTRRRVGYALLAALAYIPVLLSARGQVAADTKQYLYLDPSRLLGRAVSMWDPNIGLGTVTHQNIGYLFPMGPFYWVFQAIGVPDWVAQRLWLGSILFFAGLGMLYLFRTLGMRGPGVVVGVLAFMLTPYVLDYSARISVILLPWAGLPWMLALTMRALRRGGWRYPALFAIVVQIVGGVNATALVFAGIAPLLWIVYDTFVTREVPWRRALTTTAKIGGLTLVSSLWWMSGLWAQGAYGLDILKFTETVQTVAKTSLAPEVLRGLGYWFFYGQDKLGPWIEAGKNYTQWSWLILVSYLVPTLALLAAALVRWRHRTFFVAVALIGVAVAVGAYPYDHPSPLGALFKAFAQGSTAGLALRSTARAVPLVVLGLSVLLAAGVGAVWQELSKRGFGMRGLFGAGAVGLIVIVNLPALWNGTFYGKNLERPSNIPKYWQQAISDVNAKPHDTRILEMPGSDFASYQWGNTVDPITPGLTDRPYVARELIPWGSPPAADLLNAFDQQMQEGVLDPAAIAPLARMMSSGDILLRYDLQTGRYNLVRPKSLERLFTPTPAGLTGPTDFGTTIPGTLKYPQLDEQALTAPPGEPSPPPVAVYHVDGAPTIVRAQSTDAPTVVAGDGEGVVDAASVGLIDGNGLVLYSASYAHDQQALRDAISHNASLVVTDTNRAQARRWSTVRDNLGYTEQPGETPLVTDPSDARLDVFPGAPTGAYTTTQQRGVKTVQASDYGNPVSYTPEDRAERALDGDTYTAWKVGAFASVDGERIRITLEHPITTDHVNLVQPLNGPRERWITKVTITFDGKHQVTRTLDDASRSARGQTITFPKRRFSTFQVRIDRANIEPRHVFAGLSAVGFSEIRLRDDRAGAADVRVDEVVQMPSDLLDAAGAPSLDHALSLVMTRERTLPVPPRYDPELSIARVFSLPVSRVFSLTGAARINPLAPDDLLDRILGAPGPAQGGVVATSSEHLAGNVEARASSAIDGDPSTAWVTPFVGVADQWVDYKLPAPITFDHMDLSIVADGRHSVPTGLRVQAGGQTRTVEIPPITDRAKPDATVNVPVRFAPLTGNDVRVTITSARDVTTLEYFSASKIVMPAAIAELGIPGLHQAAATTPFDSGCRADLLSIDGRPLPVRVSGSRAVAQYAEGTSALSVTTCDPATGAATPGVTLGRGEHLLRSAQGRLAGINLDRLVLSSSPGGAAAPSVAPGAVAGRGGTVPTSAGDTTATSGPGAPTVKVTKSGRTKMTVRVGNATGPFYLVLGESLNDGWKATTGGRDLGAPQLVDGYANGWRISPAKAGPDMTVTLEWTPQRVVWASLYASLAALLLCLGIAAVSMLRGRSTRARRAASRASGEPSRDSVPGVADTAAEDLAGGAVDQPVLVSPFVAGGSRPSKGVVGVGTLLAAILGAVFVGPWVGLLVGALVLLVLVKPRMRWVLNVTPFLAVGLCGLYIAAKQVHGNIPPTFEWPTAFSQVNVLGWLAIVLLAADVIVERLRGDDGIRREAVPTEAPRGDD